MAEIFGFLVMTCEAITKPLHLDVLLLRNNYLSIEVL